jgi:hypothetical protein
LLTWEREYFSPFSFLYSKSSIGGKLFTKAP